MKQRRVLITGAGSGLGKALAERYARAGCKVACVDIDLARAQLARAALPGEGHLAFQADVGSDASMEALHEAVIREWHGVDVLINNAGIASGGNMVETTMEEWRKVIDIDLLSVVRGCRLFVPGMIAAGSGQVLSTASFAGLAGAPGIMSYGVAKAGVVALSEGLRAELHRHGISVGVFCPAFFKTNLMETAIGTDRIRSFAQRAMDTSPDSLDAVADRTFAAAERGEFLILPTTREPMRWRMKRWFPNFYFKQLLKMAAAQGRV